MSLTAYPIELRHTFVSKPVRKLGMNDCGIGKIDQISVSKLKIRILCR
jgi:hypothetical protein